MFAGGPDSSGTEPEGQVAAKVLVTGSEPTRWATCGHHDVIGWSSRAVDVADRRAHSASRPIRPEECSARWEMRFGSVERVLSALMMRVPTERGRELL